MKIAICDDCIEDALYLKNFLYGQDCRIYVDTDRLFADVEDKNMSYDLYFLDIYMGDSADGIELAKKLRAIDADAVLCFISNSDAFYREAYDIYAIQYLLKPVQKEKLKQLVDKVSKSLAKRKEQSLRFQYRGQTGMISYGKILFISSREHTIFIYCTDGTVQECRGKLNELAAQLCGDVFLRCHQSFLVNMYQVDHFNTYEIMISGHRIPVSRRYCAEVKRRYQEILFEEVE